MTNIKKKFENETKVRINIIGYTNSGRSSLQRELVKKGVFDEISFANDNKYDIFPTEILCSSPKNNRIILYLSMKNEKEILKVIKENILRAIYESFLIIAKGNINKEIQEETCKKAFNRIMRQFGDVYLNKFYEVDNIESIFREINFNQLLNELKRMNYTNYNEILENKDDFLWKNYFNAFQVDLKKQYHKWIQLISKYYIDNDCGYEYVNEYEGLDNKYSNTNFYSLCKILYGIKSSCAFIIERAYIEAPSSNEKYLGNVFIDYTNCIQYRSIYKTIENRVGEDYKELFIVLAKSSEDIKYFSKFKENINKTSLDKRIFCVLNEFEVYKDQILKHNNKENVVDSLRSNISKEMGISKDKIIVTEEFKDIDKKSLISLDTNNDFLNLLRLIKVESENTERPIKIKSSNKEKIINISLNEERMSVQTLMGMLYERYNGYLVDLWNKIIENGKNHKKYYYSTTSTIIRNRKDDYKEYKYVIGKSNHFNYKRTIDFSLRSGDYNDSKRILKMLLNYGYNTVGFDSNENKILVNVNGQISNEDKDRLIKSIKGRLEESAINYFESAFLMDVSKKKFNTNSLYKALESEKNITIDDFYSAFKEIFKKMSENIVRYEVSLQ